MKVGILISVLSAFVCASVSARDNTIDIAVYESAVYTAFQDRTFFTELEIIDARQLIYAQANSGNSQAQRLVVSLDKRSRHDGVVAR